MTGDLLDKIGYVEHVASLSDHFGVLMTFDFEFDSNYRSTGGEGDFRNYWKLNNSILCDDVFLHYFSKLWDDLKTRKVNYGGVDEWWNDEVKLKVRNFALHFQKKEYFGEITPRSFGCHI